MGMLVSWVCCSCRQFVHAQAWGDTRYSGGSAGGQGLPHSQQQFRCLTKRPPPVASAVASSFLPAAVRGRQSRHSPSSAQECTCMRAWCSGKWRALKVLAAIRSRPGAAYCAEKLRRGLHCPSGGKHKLMHVKAGAPQMAARCVIRRYAGHGCASPTGLTNSKEAVVQELCLPIRFHSARFRQHSPSCRLGVASREGRSCGGEEDRIRGGVLALGLSGSDSLCQPAACRQERAPQAVECDEWHADEVRIELPWAGPKSLVHCRSSVLLCLVHAHLLKAAAACSLQAAECMLGPKGTAC